MRASDGTNFELVFFRGNLYELDDRLLRRAVVPRRQRIV
jgi:hypothetical protein